MTEDAQEKQEHLALVVSQFNVVHPSFQYPPFKLISIRCVLSLKIKTSLTARISFLFLLTMMR